MPDERRARSGRGPILTLAVVGAGAFFAYLARDSGNTFPEAASGTSAFVVERVETAMEGVWIGEIEIRVAVYGNGGEPRLLAAIYGGYPKGSRSRR
jgi:hypothetical protein